MAAIDRFFASAHSLPALPEVALKLFDTFGREQTTLGEVADLISKDTALSMRVLRMANSARYGMRRQVGHLQDAAALLGLDALRGLALTACLADAFPRPAGFDRRRFWAQNLATAGYARVLLPGGRLVFATSHPIRWAFPDVPGRAGLTVTQSYFDTTPYAECDDRGQVTYVEHHRTLGERVREVVAAGLELVDLVEPTWPSRNEHEWGGWSPLRGALIPGTAIFVARKPDGRARG